MKEEKNIYSITDTLEIKGQIELAEMAKGDYLTDAEKASVITETVKKLASYKLRSDELRNAKIRKAQERKKSANSDLNWSWSANTYRR